MSNTPRTDEFYYERKRRPSDAAWLRFARILERELADTKAEFSELETRLAYAEDAAAKGDLARRNAGGMEMRIAELEADNKEMFDQLIAERREFQKWHDELLKSKAEVEALREWQQRAAEFIRLEPHKSVLAHSECVTLPGNCDACRAEIIAAELLAELTTEQSSE